MELDRREWLKLAGGAAVAVSLTSGEASGGNRDYAPALARLRRHMAAECAALGLPGMILALADADGFRATLATGWADREAKRPIEAAHLFQIGSITKSVAALAAFRLAEAGRLDLDSEIREHLPEVPLPAEAKITIRQLLGHCAGLPEDVPIFPRGGDGRLWLGFAPGSAFSYSNTGFDLVGRMLERIEGLPFPEIAERLVLRPLGMATACGAILAADRQHYAVGYAPQEIDRPFPRGGAMMPGAWTDVAQASGSVAATAGDMTRYVAGLIAIGSGSANPLLSPDWAKRFTTPQIDAPDWVEAGDHPRYAHGLVAVTVDGRPCLHHTGGMIAFNSAITVDPGAGIGAFASVNAGGFDYRPRGIVAYANRLMRAIRDRVPLPEAPVIEPVNAVEKGGDYAGTWMAANGDRFELRAARGLLTLRADGLDVVLEPSGEDRFTVHHPRFARFSLAFGRKDGAIAEAGWGSTAYTRDTAPPVHAAEPGHAALVGRYQSDDPWADIVRIVSRAGKLWFNGEQELVALPDGSYRIGADPNGAERVRFEAMLAGRAQRLVLSGKDLPRVPLA